MKKYATGIDLYGELSQKVEQLGKILIVTGPPSSGKSTLLITLLKNIPNLYTINKQAIKLSIVPKIDELFFTGLLEEAKKLTSKEIENGYDLLQLNVQDIEDSTIRYNLKVIKDKQKAILESQELNQISLYLFFKACYNEIKGYIFSGQNVILDETSIDSDRVYHTFQECCDYYPHIKRLLIFDSLEGIYIKSAIRNAKFAQVLSGEDLEKSIAQVIKETEIVNRTSITTYRAPKEIISNYRKYYNFKTQVDKNELILGNITKKCLKSVLTKMAMDQLKILGLLKYRGENVTRDFIDVQNELDNVFDIHSNTAYIVSRTNPDYIISVSEWDLKLLDNWLFVRNSLKTVLAWFKSSSASSDIAIYPEIEKKIKGTESATHDFTLILSQLKYKFDSNLDNRHKTIILNNLSYDTRELDIVAKILIDEVLEGKIITALFCSIDNFVSVLMIRGTSEEKIEGIYYNSLRNQLENDNTVLTLLLFLDFYIQELKLENVHHIEIKDLSRESGQTFYCNSWYGFIKLSKSIECSLSHALIEWSLWSKCFGKVILVNGVSCSGKTTLVKYLEQFGFYKIVVDDIYFEHYKSYLNTIIPDLIDNAKTFLTSNDFRKVLLQFKIDPTPYSEFVQNHIEALQSYLSHNSEAIARQCPPDRKIFDIVYDKAKGFIFSGQNVAIDLIMTEQQQINIFSYCFHFYPNLKSILIALPLEKNLKQCFSRNMESFKFDLVNARLPSQVIELYLLMYNLVRSEAMNSNSIWLEKVDKKSLKDVLRPEIVNSTFKMLDSTFEREVYIKEREKYKKLVKKINKLIDSAANEDIIIIPTIKHDYIINGLKLHGQIFGHTQEVILESKELSECSEYASNSGIDILGGELELTSV